jgi:hypothetical protein
MYHPAAALHQASLRETLFRDVRGLPAALLAARAALDAEAEHGPWRSRSRSRSWLRRRRTPDAEQMTLFQER